MVHIQGCATFIFCFLYFSLFTVHFAVAFSPSAAYLRQGYSGVPDVTAGCGGESGGNRALYVAARHPIARFAERVVSCFSSLVRARSPIELALWGALPLSRRMLVSCARGFQPRVSRATALLSARCPVRAISMSPFPQIHRKVTTKKKRPQLVDAFWHSVVLKYRENRYFGTKVPQLVALCGTLWHSSFVTCFSEVSFFVWQFAKVPAECIVHIS